MTELTKEEREQALRDFETKQNKRLSVGKTIVIFIASANVFLSIASAVLIFELVYLIALIVQIALSVALISGITWVRHFLAVRAILNVYNNIRVVLGVSAAFHFPVWVIVVLLAELVYWVASCIVLFVDKNVVEYMYAKKYHRKTKTVIR